MWRESVTKGCICVSQTVSKSLVVATRAKQRTPGRQGVRLLVQPGASIAPLIKAIGGAKKSIKMMIFRFNRREIEKALVNAVERGVEVRALLACTNQGGERNLGELETRLVAKGVKVTRTADDLLRYHAKLMIVD